MIIDFEIDASGTLPLASLATTAALAEDAGFAGIWKGETSNRDPLVLLTAIAGATRRVALGTAVLHLLARSPVAAGMAAATLNEISDGRLLLGLGVANPALANWHGTRFGHPLDMAEDYITIVRQTLASGRVSVNGKAFQSKDFRLAGSWTAPAAPIYLAALGPKMTDLAGTIADGIMINLAPPEEVRRIGDRARKAADKAGRDPEAFNVVAKLRVALSSDLDKARATLRPTVAVYVRAAGYRDLLLRAGFASEVAAVDSAWNEGGFGAAIRAVPDSMIDNLPSKAVSRVEDLAAAIAEFADAGVDRLIIPLIPVGDALEDTTAFLSGWRDWKHTTQG